MLEKWETCKICTRHVLLLKQLVRAINFGDEERQLFEMERLKRRQAENGELEPPPLPPLPAPLWKSLKAIVSQRHCAIFFSV